MNEVSLLNTLFDGLSCGLAMPELESPAYAPAVDVLEHKDSYEIVMDLPGKTQDDIELTVKDNVHTIASKSEEKASEQKAEDKQESKFLIRERCSASFKRSFSLPRNADSQQISAQFKNGVLAVKIPCKAELAERKIQINVA